MGTGGATALLSPECGTALAVSLLSQRRKREAESLVTLSILRSTIHFQKNNWFSEIYIQEGKAQRFKASFCFKILCLLCVPLPRCQGNGLTEKEMIKPNGLLVLLS